MSVGRIAESWEDGPLAEAWSDKARAAAILARRARSGGRGLGAEAARALGASPELQIEHDRLSQERKKTALGLARGLGALKHGESYSVDLPEGQINVTRHERGPLRRVGFHVSGGGAHPSPEKRRGSRDIFGRQDTEREVMERQRAVHAADEVHTAQHAVQAHGLGVGESHHMVAETGEHVRITKRADGGFSTQHQHASGDWSKATVHRTADEAVMRGKKDARARGARFLDEHHHDPLDVSGTGTPDVRGYARRSVGIEAHRAVPSANERVDKLNPVGAIGDIAPDIGARVASGSHLATGPGLEPPEPVPSLGSVGGGHQAATSSLGDHLNSILHHPAVHHAVTQHGHVIHHVLHHLLAGLEYQEGVLQEAVESGNALAELDARLQLDELRATLRSELQRAGVPT